MIVIRLTLCVTSFSFYLPIENCPNLVLHFRETARFYSTECLITADFENFRKYIVFCNLNLFM